MDPNPGNVAPLTWVNVGVAFSFIVLDAAVSRVLNLGLGSSIVIAAIRCIAQLLLVALILQKVFDTNNPWGVAGVACEYFTLYLNTHAMTKHTCL